MKRKVPQEVTQQRDCCQTEIEIGAANFVCHHIFVHGPIVFDTAGSLCSLIEIVPDGQAMNGVKQCKKRISLEALSKQELTNFERRYEFQTRQQSKIDQQSAYHASIASSDRTPVSTQKKQSSKEHQTKNQAEVHREVEAIPSTSSEVVDLKSALYKLMRQKFFHRMKRMLHQLFRD